MILTSNTEKVNSSYSKSAQPTHALKITKAHLLDVWRIEPTLAYGGFNQGSREQLVNAIDEIQICFDWLQQQQIAKRISCRSHSSYFLKHCAEFAADVYVSNGAFLAAVILAGVPYRRYGMDHPNAACAVVASKRNRALHGDKWHNAPSFAEYKPLQAGAR